MSGERGFVRIADHPIRTEIGVAHPLVGCRKTQMGKTALAPRTAGPVNDLTAIRAVDEISLNWTIPLKGVRKLLVNGSIGMRVCRLESKDSECIETGHPLLLPPSTVARFAEELPASMKSGPPRVSYYAVTLIGGL